jgi:transposase
MTQITRIGLDLAKNVFEVHAVNAQEQVAVRRSLRRNQVLNWFAKQPPCLIGMEACGTANHWARELTALGHTVRMIPPAYAKPYVRRNKNDAADAAAICEAVSRPSMRFVPIKTEEQQADAVTHKTRQLLVKQRTMAQNSLRGLMAEFGVVVPQGPQHIGKLLAILADPEDPRPGTADRRPGQGNQTPRPDQSGRPPPGHDPRLRTGPGQRHRRHRHRPTSL